MRKTVKVANPHHEKNKHKTNPHDMFMEEEDTGDGGDMKKIFIGMVPIMLKSTYCMLTGLDDSELQKMNECQYDQVIFLLAFVGKCIFLSRFSFLGMEINNNSSVCSNWQIGRILCD